jgi:hypothetical protein
MGYSCAPLDSVEALVPDVVLPPSPSWLLQANLLLFHAMRRLAARLHLEGHRLAIGIAL